MNAREFLAALHEEIESHPAVNHPLLCRVSRIPFTREDYKVFGLQHYALVGNFTAYLEHLLITAPDSDAKQWLAKVLVDEYGEGSDGKDHAELYREFLAACGARAGEELETELHENVSAFVAEHFRIVREEPFLVGLGAVGPGHEWSIPKMFPRIVRGLRTAGFREEEINYFVLHLGQDIDHGRWLEEALVRYADDAQSQRQIRRGALLSLEARARFWSGVQDKVVRWRQPVNTHLRTQNRRSFYNHKIEISLQKLQSKIAVWRGLEETF
jgi:pyrroloquinoline quinone (PQQ) biosynthesis protein C